ncbi:MAG: molybdopterin molybdenumtransferase MoeA, partial [Roseovarius sp.]|nr:molybdopterin molybdenumtransferase MoeA [Roseovarius sp.]
MTPFDSFAMVDWSGGNDTGPRPRRDAIWLGSVRQGVEDPPRYLRNRGLAEEAIAGLIEAERQAGRRLLIGFVFPFGFPAGFARALTGRADPFAVWDWLEAQISDSPRANNRFDVAAMANGMFPGTGPFWFNGLRRDIAGLTRRDTRAGHGQPERRLADASGTFTCWQLGGAGAVGGQVLTGLPVLNRLRRRFAGDVAVWPFEDLARPVAFVEIWPGLISDMVRRAEKAGGIRDAHQVRLMASALARLPAPELAAMLAVEAPEEGWIMGLGHEDKLRRAAEGLKPPPLRDDCFALPGGVDWTPADQALALLRARLHRVVGQEQVDLSRGLGRVLAAPVIARRANPPHPNTAVDGYGFAFADLGEGDQTLPLVQGRAAAGVPYDGAVPPGHALRVLTGA